MGLKCGRVCMSGPAHLAGGQEALSSSLATGICFVWLRNKFTELGWLTTTYIRSLTVSVGQDSGHPGSQRLH